MGRSGRLQGVAVAVVAAETASAVPERVPSIEMAAGQDPEAGAGAAAGLLGHLQGHAREGDDVVAADHALVLHAEDLVEVDAAERDKRRRRIGRRPGKLGVEGRQKSLPHVAVGGRDGGDARPPAAR